MKWNRLAIPLVLALGFAACDGADPTAPEVPDPAESRFFSKGPTIADIAIELASDEENPEFTILVQALAAADLVETLDGSRRFTVFAPTDAAFGRLLELLDVSAEELLADTELLTEVLLYHVARGRRFSNRVLSRDKIRTLNGESVFPTTTGEGAFIVDGSPLTEDAELQAPDLIDIKASNGVIHVIDEVLLPPRFGGPGTIVDIATGLASDEDNPEFTILVQALAAADLVETLDGSGPFTVFAPTDAAFGRLLERLGVSAEDLLSDEDLLRDVLLYHVVKGRRFSDEVLRRRMIRTVAGGFIFPRTTDEGAFVFDGSLITENAQLLAPELIDIPASNGVIHVIDEVLLPRDFKRFADEVPAPTEGPTIAGLVSSLANSPEPEFTILLAALEAADLVGVLDGHDDFTVFAPTDAAFGRLLALLGVSPEELLSNTELLTDVLLYHVAPGRKLSGDILSRRFVKTVNGRAVFPRLRRGELLVIDRSRATETARALAPDLIDVQATNGVVHVIDEVLLPH